MKTEKGEQHREEQRKLWHILIIQQNGGLRHSYGERGALQQSQGYSPVARSGLPNPGQDRQIAIEIAAIRLEREDILAFCQ